MAIESESDNSETATSNVTILKSLHEKGIHYKEIIGKGTFSSVRCAWHDEMKQNVALKIIDTSSNSDFIVRFLPREKIIVQQLNHANIIKNFEIINEEPYVCFIQEYAMHGDLLQRIKKNDRIDEEEGRFYFRQLIEALTYLKSISIAHRDIKCENVLLDNCDNVKLSDFGFARFMNADEVSHTFCGSRAYVAPELLRSCPYNGFLADIWSAGILLYVMVTGFMPYDDRNITKMLEKQLQHRITFPRRRNLSVEVKELIYSMVHPEPLKRRPYHEVILSTWLADTKYELRSEPFSQKSD
ncbi:CAMK/TSSK protein kinase [Loa loa]|uniref:CAMK/TSSK protein kinase n=2 Tax=Loa loa TaxID=7209 RepID=A0A1S0UHI7_LOALO|nr:CAMK/TSSK protein kinase [Loa loa]EJD75162.1 CAMK/TSSK protein kinase [Loa loa]